MPGKGRTKKSVPGLTKKLEDLPVLPAVVVRLMATGPSSELYFDEVLSLAETDPPFAARVIRASNSSESAPASQIDGLRDAVTRLGARRIGELVTSLAVARVFVPQTDDERRLWSHSLEVATIAREIAMRRSVPELSADRAYLAGLLHDLGRFVMFDEAPNELAAVDETGWSSPDELVETERDQWGFDHAELGWEVCRHWGIPMSIAEVVRLHHEHDPSATLTSASAASQAIAVVQLADLLSVQHAVRPDLFDLPETERHELLTAGVSSLWDPAPISGPDLDGFLSRSFDEARGAAKSLGLAG